MVGGDFVCFPVQDGKCVLPFAVALTCCWRAVFRLHRGSILVDVFLKCPARLESLADLSSGIAYAALVLDNGPRRFVLRWAF